MMPVMDMAHDRATRASASATSDSDAPGSEQADAVKDLGETAEDALERLVNLFNPTDTVFVVDFNNLAPVIGTFASLATVLGLLIREGWLAWG